MKKKYSFQNYKDYIQTFVFEGVVFLVTFFFFRIAIVQFGHTGFSEYSIIKRTIAFIFPIFFLGMGVGIPRFISISDANVSLNNKTITSGTYFIAGSLIVISITCILSIIMYLFRDTISILMFSSKDYHYYVLPIIINLLSLILHSLIYAYFRGKLKMLYANILQLTNIAILPLISFYISRTLSEFFCISALLIIIFSSFFLIFIFKEIKTDKKDLINASKELVKYGIPRIPGDILQSFLFVFPSYLIIHLTKDIYSAGYTAFAMSLVSMYGTIYSPISLILLPETSKMITQGKIDELFVKIKQILFVTLIFTISTVIIFEIFSTYFLSVYLKEINHKIVLISRLVIPAAIGYSVYIVLRSIIDAHYFKAVNTQNIIYTFIIYFLSIYVLILLDFVRVSNILINFVISITFLGMITFYSVLKIKYSFKK